MPTCTYNPKFKHVKIEDLEVGETYVCGDEEHEASFCWRKNGEVVPFKLTCENEDEAYERKTLNNEDSDGGDVCNCEDLDHLYLYEETLMSTHPLANLKTGDLLKDICGNYRRALSDVMYPELGDLATVVMSAGGSNKNHADLKRFGNFFTLFELEEQGLSIVSETKPTREEILAKLPQEERDIIEGKIK